jgi:hypothetical protein
LAELRGRLEALLQEVRTMVRAADGLFDLGRFCLMCERELIEPDPVQPVRCECGWVWE